MRDLIESLSRLCEAMRDEGHTCGDRSTGGVYNVSKLYKHLKKHVPVQRIKLHQLANGPAHEGSWYRNSAQKEQLKKARMFPIIVVKSGRGKNVLHQVTDGHHRAYKAFKRGDSSIRAYVVPQHKLPKSARAGYIKPRKATR